MSLAVRAGTPAEARALLEASHALMESLFPSESNHYLSIEALAAPFQDKGIDAVAAVEARGFIFGSAVAKALGCGFVPVRKKGKLPYQTESVTYDLEYGQEAQSSRFWYYSEDKLEPRFGRRYEEDGADREMPLAVARDVAALSMALEAEPAERPLGDFVLDHPEHMRTVRRVQLNQAHPYSEIHDNLIAEDVRPIDILRFKLAFFGACRFDPKSDLWTRISMYMGAPLPDELPSRGMDSWSFPVAPGNAV